MEAIGLVELVKKEDNQILYSETQLYTRLYEAENPGFKNHFSPSVSSLNSVNFSA